LVTRSLTLPRNTAVIVPIINWVFIDALDTTPAQVAHDDSIIAAGQPTPGPYDKMSAEVDGNPVYNLPLHYKWTKRGFDILCPDTAIFGWELINPLRPHHYNACASGFYIMVDEFSPGNHTIHFHAENGGLLMDVTYAITVR
jgi:hypothetical protein